jgi:hypothetical protein
MKMGIDGRGHGDRFDGYPAVMVQAIGIMLSAYIISRNLEMMEVPKPAKRIAAALSALVAIAMAIRVLNENGLGW